MEVVHADLGIVVVASVAEGVDGGNGTAGGVICSCTYAPGVVVIAGNRCATGVGNTDDIALQVLLEVERLLIIDNAADAVLGVIQGNQNIIAAGLFQDLRTVQSIGMCPVRCSLAGSDAVGIIGVYVFAEGLQLPALFPGQNIAQIVGGIFLTYPVYLLFCTVSTNSAYHKSGRSCERPLPLGNHTIELGIRREDTLPSLVLQHL